MCVCDVCRLYDVPDSELIKHWEKTYRFIKEAKYVCCFRANRLPMHAINPTCSVMLEMLRFDDSQCHRW